MRGDYEEHLAQCQHCRSKRVLHRVIDFGLITIATVSAAIFLLAFSLVRHYSPSHVVILELTALAGFLFSSLMWIIVAGAAPVPGMLNGAAQESPRRPH